MSIFRPKGGTIYYAGFGCDGRYFVRSTGTENRQEALRVEKRLRALAKAGKLMPPTSEERAASIARSLQAPQVKRRHVAKNREAADRRDADPAAKQDWIESIRAGQSRPEVKRAMKDASDRTAANPVSQKRKSRSMTAHWRRRGHRARVRKSMRAKWRSEWRAYNMAGRDRAAIERLEAQGFSIMRAEPRRRRGERGRAKETDQRIALAAAAVRLGKKSQDVASKLYPNKTRRSAEASCYDLFHRYGAEIEARAWTLSVADAEAFWPSNVAA